MIVITASIIKPSKIRDIPVNYTSFGTISGRVADLKILKDSERAEVGGAPAVTEVTKVYPNVEVRAYEIIPEDMETGGQYFRNYGDMGIRTFTDSEGNFSLKIPLKSSSEKDGKYVQVYLPQNPFSSESGILKDTLSFIVAHPTRVQNQANFTNEY